MNDLLINRILVTTDFSTSARRAVDYGMCIARAWSAHVDLLSVVEVLRGFEFDAPFADPLLEMRRKEATRLLGDLATRVKREGLDVDWHLREGIPSEPTLSSWARMGGPDWTISCWVARRSVSSSKRRVLC